VEGKMMMAADIVGERSVQGDHMSIFIFVVTCVQTSQN
jgi:hypothetical protein